MPLPFVSHVGAEILEGASGVSLLKLVVAAHHMNSQGVVHGGALFTLADTGMGVALYSALAPGERCSTIEVKINYFKPVVEGAVVCRSVIANRTRSYAALESTLTVGEVVVATATGTFAVLPPRAQSAA